MDSSPSDARQQGFAAFERRDWVAAFEALRGLGESGQLDPDEEMTLASAAGFANFPVETRLAFERAIAGYERAGRPGDAARACVDMMRLVGERLGMANTRAWMLRAERLAAAAGDHVGAGCVLGLKAAWAYRMGELERTLELSEQALAIARRHGDVGLEALAINRIGRVLIRQGRVPEGQQRIDEAMALVATDAVAPVSTFVVYCSTIDACTDLADYRRAAEYTVLASEWCLDHSITGISGICRVHRAEVLRVRGAWELAAFEIRAACDELASLEMQMAVGAGLCEKGIQYTSIGDFAAAEEAFREAHARGVDPHPGLAQLWLKQGKVIPALNALARALDDVEGKPLLRAKLLPTYVEAALEAGDAKRARIGCEELEDIAERFLSSGLRAEALEARGTERLAADDPRGVTILRRALREWHEIGAPYRVARIRGLLADAHEREGDSTAADIERGAARDAFARLGASIDLERITMPGRSTPAPGRSTPPPTRPHSHDVTLDASQATTVVIHDDPVARLIDGKLEIVRKLGEGGMGRVYAARHRLLGRDVAVKLLRAGACDDPQQCQRLLQEALTSGQIRHPNVVEVFDAGLDRGEPYLVLELLDGESLANRLTRSGRLELREAIDVILQALAGVGAAHQRGIVHRDLKPDNLFVLPGPPQRIKVLDFGIAKLEDGGAMAASRTGALAGTPYYMSPEQVEGVRDLDPRVDVYALAVVLYELLTGTRPFTATGYGALLIAIMTQGFPSCRAHRPELPVELDEVIRRAGARDRGQRYANAEAFAVALRPFA